jgi:pimeloyl-ACP methyl ester carboxylesterase
MSVSPVEYGTINGIRFAKVSSGHGPWIVLTHGAFCSLADWLPFAEQLAKSHNLLMWDLPGHGGSAHLTPVRSLDEAAKALGSVMDAAGVPSAIQLGFSFGGMTAQAFARKNPSRTNALIAYACVPITRLKTPPRWLLRLLIRLHFLLTPRKAFIDRFAIQATVAPSVRATVIKAAQESRADLAPAIFEAMADGASWEPGFTLACPVAVLTGELDNRFPRGREEMIQWGQSLPDGLWIDVGACGHFVHRESPDKFADALQTLINRIGQDGGGSDLP